MERQSGPHKESVYRGMGSKYRITRGNDGYKEGRYYSKKVISIYVCQDKYVMF